MAFRAFKQTAAAALTVVAAGMVSGMMPGAAEAQISLRPSVGMYVPVSELGQVEGVAGGVELGKAESTLAYGVAVEFGSIRANLAYAGNSDIPVDGVGCETCSARSTMLAGTVALAIRPIPQVLFFQPYLLAGGGLKRYNFDPENFDEEGLDGILDDQNQFAGQVGLGLDFSLGGLGLFTELNDYISKVELAPDDQDFDWDSDLQHDMIWSLGISLGG
jgi:hypothetical protein